MFACSHAPQSTFFHVGNRILPTSSITFVLSARMAKQVRSISLYHFEHCAIGQRINVVTPNSATDMMVNDITFLWFLLFSMCQPLHVAVNKCINWCFVQNCYLYWQQLSHNSISKKANFGMLTKQVQIQYNISI